MLFDISHLRFPKLTNGVVNGGLLVFKNDDLFRQTAYSKNLISEYGSVITKFVPGSVYVYSQFDLPAKPIITIPDSTEAFELGCYEREMNIRMFIHFLWLVKDNSIGLHSSLSEVPDLKIVKSVSASIINFNCRGELQDTVFTEHEFKEAAELSLEFWNIMPKGVMKLPEIIYSNDKIGNVIMGIIPKNSKNFNYNNQNSLERALHFLIIARNQSYLVYRIAYLMPIFECLFSTDPGELTTKLSYRTALYVSKDKAQRIEISRLIKKGYDIRSRFLHGQLFDKDSDISDEKLIRFSTELEKVVRECLVRIIRYDSTIFLDKDKQRRNDFFDDLVFS